MEVRIDERLGFTDLCGDAVVSGKLAVLRNDPSGVLYSLADAELVETSVK